MHGPESDSMEYFCISEVDLAALEQTLPELMDANMLQCNDPVVRKRWECVRDIVTKVRWKYGPPTETEVIE